MARYEELTDDQWSKVEPHLPKLRVRKDRRGRPWRTNREILNGILWILRSGARWCDLPERYPSYSACYQRFRKWVNDGTLRKVLEALAKDLHERGKIDLEECFVDGTFIGAKKGVPESVKRVVARGPRSWQSQTLQVFQSQFTQQVLHQMKSPLSKILCDKLFSPMLHDDLLVTELMTVIDLIEGSGKEKSK